MSDLTAKRALVTGATSGIGAATARAFAAAGARLVLSGRDRARGEAVAAEIVAGGGEARFHRADLRDSGACDALVAAAVQSLGGLDILVNDAGVFHRGDVATIEPWAWRETLAVNLDAVFFLSRAAVRLMHDRGGAIVNVASDWALTAGEDAVAYCAAKGGVLMLTRAMALDHAREGIRINAVCPGEVETPMLTEGVADLEAARARWAEAVPLGRIASPEDVAEAILFLASPRARHMTGSALVIDGGAGAA